MREVGYKNHGGAQESRLGMRIEAEYENQGGVRESRPSSGIKIVHKN